MNYIIEQNQELWDNHVDIVFGDWVKKQGFLSSAIDDDLFNTFLEEHRDSLEEDFIIRYREVIDETIHNVVFENEQLKRKIKAMAQSAFDESQILQLSLQQISTDARKISHYCSDIAVHNNSILDSAKDDCYY